MQNSDNISISDLFDGPVEHEEPIDGGDIDDQAFG